MEEEKNTVPIEQQDLPEDAALPTHSRHAGTAKSRVLWSLIFVVIAALTIWAVTSQGGFSLTEFSLFIRDLEPGWLIAAIFSMVCIIVFEGLAVISIAKSFGYKRSPLHGAVYAASDIYFSAITPSATGGQPASAFFMMKDKIPGPVVTVTLLVNLIMYTFGILILGVLSFILAPSLFLNFSFIGKVLIVVGSLMLCLAAAAFILILVKSSILRKICDLALTFLAKIRIVKNVDVKKEKMNVSIDACAGYVSQLRGKRSVLIKALIFNIIQRASAVFVTVFSFFAAGGAASSGVDVFVAQCMVILGSNTMPIPGAMGISDFLLIDAFGGIGLSQSEAVNLNLLSRTVAFYSCVILCAIVMITRLAVYAVQTKKEKRFDIHR